MPVPAGTSLPMMMFSFSPMSLSLRHSMAASVSTRVVSWKEAAESHESVASDALVMPMSSGRPSAGRRLSATSIRFVSANSRWSTCSPGRKSDSPGLLIFTRRVICRTISSMCLSWMDTPWSR